MNTKQLQTELDKYKRQYKIIVERNVQLENQYEKQEEKITQMAKSLEQCQKALDMSKTMLRQISAEHSKKENSLVDFMNGLKSKLREMGYNGDFNRLGNESN